MVVPVSPVIEGLKHKEVTLRADETGTRGLPCLRFADQEGTVLTRWELTWRERLSLILRGTLWIAQRTHWDQFQSICIIAELPGVTADELIPGGQGGSIAGRRPAPQPPE